MGTYRIFLAHSKDADDTELELLRTECIEAAKLKLGSNPFSVTLAREDYEQRLASCGGWDGWVRSVAQDTDAFGTPLFDAYIIPFVKGGLVGKATGGIAALAEQGGKPVRALSGGVFHNIADIQVERPGFNPLFRMVVPGLS